MRCLLPPDAPEHVCDIRRRTVQVPNPAAGADWSVQIPVAEAWDVQGLVATLTTSAVVATRSVILVVLDNAVTIRASQPSQGAAASTIKIHALAPGGTPGSNANSNTAEWGGPSPYLVAPGRTLAVATNNIDVGDQWSAIALDVLFELNRGAGAAKRYADWRRAQAAALPPDRLASGDFYRG